MAERGEPARELVGRAQGAHALRVGRVDLGVHGVDHADHARQAAPAGEPRVAQALAPGEEARLAPELGGVAGEGEGRADRQAEREHRHEQESLSHVEPFAEIEPPVHGRAREQPPRRGAQPAVERLEERVRAHATSRLAPTRVPSAPHARQSGTQTMSARTAGAKPVASAASMSAAPLPTAAVVT